MVRAKSPTALRSCRMVLCIVVVAMSTHLVADDSLVDVIAAPEFQPALLPFAAELEDGPFRLLLIAPARTLRDGVEIARRLPIRLDVLAVADIERDLDILGEALANQPDVIALANFDFNRLPEPALAGIADHGARGVGLVLIQRHAELPDALRAHLETLAPLDDVAPLTRGTGLELIPGWREDYAFVDARASDTSRAIEITYLADLPTFHCLIPAPPGRTAAEAFLLDSYFTTPARTFLWAANREPDIWITAIEEIRPPGPDIDEVPPFLPEPFIENQQRAAAVTPLATYRIRLNQPADARYAVRVRARYPYRDIAWHTDWETTWREGEDTFELQLPTGSGQLLLDIWLDKRRGAVDWFTLAQERPGLPHIEAFSVPRRVVRPVDLVEVALRLGPFVAPKDTRVTVLVRATDALGRVVGEQYHVAPEAETDFTVPMQIAGAMGGFVKVEVFALAANPPFKAGHLERATHQWTYFPVQRPYNADFAVWADGAAVLEPTPHGFNEQLAALGVDTLHHAYPYDFPEGIAWTSLNVAPATPAAAPLPWRLPCLLTETYVDGLRTTAAYWSTVASAGFLLPASGYFPDSPDVLLEEERACAKDFVDYLATEYDEFHHLYPDLHSGAAKWEDILRTWNDSEESRWHQHAWASYINSKTAETILIERAALSGGRAYLANLPPDASAALIAAANGWGVPADPAAVERVRSYQSAGSRHLLQVLATDENAPAWTWHAALHQLGGVWLTGTYPNASPPTLLAPDGRVSDTALALGTAIGSLRTGIGALVGRATHAGHTIAIYDDGTAQEENRAVLFRFLESTGMQYELVNSHEIVDSIHDYALIALPNASYLPETVVEFLDAYVAEGGRLLADLPPATEDSWGKSHNGSRGAGWFANPELQTEQPQSLLLDASFAEALENNDTARRVRAWLHDAEIHPVDEAARRNSIDFSGERFAYTYGKARLFAYSLPPHFEQNSERFRVGFDKDQYAYDLVENEPLISGNWSVARVTKDQPALYSLLPYEVSRVIISAPDSVASGQRLPFDVVVKTKDDLPGTHLVSVRITAGIDMTFPHYDQIIECPNGQGSGYISLAFDDLTTLYTLEVRDLLSGTTAVHEFSVVTEIN